MYERDYERERKLVADGCWDIDLYQDIMENPTPWRLRALRMSDGHIHDLSPTNMDAWQYIVQLTNHLEDQHD